MTEFPHKSPLDKAFEQWLDGIQDDVPLDVDAFLVQQPGSLREDLRLLIEEYQVLEDCLKGEGPPPQAGRVLGDYRLIHELGHGGMGAVWEAEQLSLKRRVALKLLKPQLSMSPTTLQRFQREAEAGGRLQHVGIVQTYGVGEENGVHWIAQELIPTGFSLADALADQRQKNELPIHWYRRIAEMFATLSDALEVAHQAGVIHRDIKPGNILIGEDDQPKIADFGLAQMQDDFALSRTGEFIGTPFYMSPEQAMSKRMGLDHRTDIFSLGATLYETLTLVRPFDGDTSQQVFQKIVTEEPPGPQKLRSRIPSDLAVICGKCLEKNQDRRYQSMADLAADLRRFLHDEPILAKPPTTWTRAVKWGRRHPVATTTGGVTVIALAVVSVMAFTIAVEQTRTESALIKAQEAEEEANWNSYLALVQAAQFAANSGRYGEAKRLLNRCPEAYRNWEWHHLKLRMDTSLLTLEGHSKDVTAVAWSPDGQRIVSGSRDQSLRIWNAKTGEAERVLEGHSRSVAAVAWSPDGQRIVSGSFAQLPRATKETDKGGNLRIWNAATSEIVHVLNGHSGSVLALDWSPDGQQFVSASNDSTLRIWDAQTGGIVLVLEGHSKSVTAVAWSPNGRRIVSGTRDGPLHIWDAQTGGIAQVVVGRHSGNVTDVAWSPDSQRLAWSSFEGNFVGTSEFLEGEGATLSIWDVEAKETVQTLEVPSGYVESLAWSPDGQRLVSGSRVGSLHIWDSMTGDRMQVLEGHSKGVTAVAWSPSGRRIVSGSSDETLHIWDSETDGSVQVLEGYVVNGTAISWSPDGKRVISELGFDSIQIWDARTGEVLQVLKGIPGNRGVLETVAWSPDGQRIVFRFYDNPPQLLNIMEAGGVRTMIGTSGDGSALAWSPDSRRIVSSSEDHTLRIWDAQTCETVQVLEGHSKSVTDVAWSPDGKRIVSCSSDYTLRIWDAQTGGTVQILEGHPGYATEVAWSPDSQRIVSGSSDGALHIWDSKTGDRMQALKGHSKVVTAVAWSPDGLRIVSGSGDDTLRLWDSETGDTVQILDRFATGIRFVAWSPDGKRLLTGSYLNPVYIYDSCLEDAKTRWEFRWLSRQVRPLVDELFRNHLFLEPVVAALNNDQTIQPELLQIALGMARARGNPTAEDLNDNAWAAVDPDRKNQDTDIGHGLVLARAAVEQAPFDANTHDTFAWALFANGFFAEAITASEKALQLAPDSARGDFQGYLNRLLKFIAEEKTRKKD